MAFVNLPANLQDLFYSITDRVAKLETGPNSAQTSADAAQTTANSAQTDATTAISNANAALAQANIAYTLAGTSLQKDSNTIVNVNNNMTAINANGITVYSGSSMTSGARVIMNYAGLTGFNSSGTTTFSISSSTGNISTVGALFTNSTIYGGELNINGNCTIDTGGTLRATGAVITGNITATSGSFTGSLYASSGTIAGWTISGVNLYSGTGAFMRSDTGNIGGNTVTAFSDFYGPTLYTTGSIEAGTTIKSNTSMTAVGSLYAAGHTTTGSTANGYVNASTGLIARSTASSARYKENITNLWDVPELNPKKLLDIPVRAFSYKLDYLKNDDRTGILIPGLIAEEVDAIYPLATDYDNGHIENINDRAILIGLLALVQEQETRITQLEGK
jgi:hypothetical protein